MSAEPAPAEHNSMLMMFQVKDNLYWVAQRFKPGRLILKAILEMSSGGSAPMARNRT